MTATDLGTVLKAVAQVNPSLVPWVLLLFTIGLGVRGVWRLVYPHLDKTLNLVNTYLEQAVKRHSEEQEIIRAVRRKRTGQSPKRRRRVAAGGERRQIDDGGKDD